MFCDTQWHFIIKKVNNTSVLKVYSVALHNVHPPSISQFHIIKYHPGIDREFYDTLLRCQLVDFNATLPAFV